MEDNYNYLYQDQNKGSQESSVVSDKELLLEYTKIFIKDDLANAIKFCYEWNGSNGYRYTYKNPEDIVFNVLELINEGRRLCYIQSYRHFKNSIYYHVKFELLSHFKFKKKSELSEDSPESLFTLTDSENFLDDGQYADDAGDALSELEKKDIRQSIFNLFDPGKDQIEIRVLKEVFLNEKRDEIAETLNISVGEVTNIQKRINRRIRKYFDKNLLEGIK